MPAEGVIGFEATSESSLKLNDALRFVMIAISQVSSNCEIVSSKLENVLCESTQGGVQEVRRSDGPTDPCAAKS